MLMGNFSTDKVDAEIIDAIDFMVERVSLLNLIEMNMPIILLICFFS